MPPFQKRRDADCGRGNRLVSRIAALFLLAALLIARGGRGQQTGQAGRQAAGQPTQAAITVDAGKVMNRISPYMFGSCIEDVNHEIYGGLYAQRIFGESFEEPPAPRSPLAGWTAYGGQWRVEGEALRASPDAGAKLVRDASSMRDGVIECDVRLGDDRDGNAALIVRVSDARTGPDNWTGYEISLNAHGKLLDLSRHHNDWHLLRSVPADVTPGTWHHVRVALAGPKLQVYLDGAAQPTLEYTDDAAAILAGRVGVRTWNTECAFRNLKISMPMPEGRIEDTLQQASGEQDNQAVSGMWDSLRTGSAASQYAWDAEQPYNSGHSQRIERGTGQGIVGVTNKGLNRWGIAVQSGQRFAGHLYLRQKNYAGRVTVALQSADGARTYARQALAPAGADWARRDFALRAQDTDAHARFALWLDRPGTVWVDQVTLAPTGSALYHNLPVRADIADALGGEGVTFLRYGGSMVNAPGYRWKKMVGPRDKRPQYAGWWYPHSTNGFGIEEFLQYCEAARITPAFAINIDETPEDAADMVEYLNGPATSAWGRRRAQGGHPKPYNVHYIEIGNEEAIDGNKAWYARYLERFNLLYPAMHARDPNLQFVIAAWWRPDEPFCKQMVQELSGKAGLWDVHVGGDDLREGENVDRLLTQMQMLFQSWSPGTNLKACIFEENGNRHDLQRAIGHAHILNVTQRHGDFVLMDCPANCLQPWRQNDNGWDQGQVFFTPGQVWGMPPYYAQQMASLNYLPLCVESHIEADSGTSVGNQNASRDLDVTATRSEDGKTLVLHVVNVGSAAHSTTINLAHFGGVSSKAGIWTLSGALQAINSPEAPEQVRSVHSDYNKAGERFGMEFAPYSYTVVRLRRAK